MKCNICYWYPAYFCLAENYKAIVLFAEKNLDFGPNAFGKRHLVSSVYQWWLHL